MGVPQTTVCVEWVWNKTSAAIAQLGERQTEDLKVPGSIPGLGISENITPFLCVSQTAFPLAPVVNARGAGTNRIHQVGGGSTRQQRVAISYLPPPPYQQLNVFVVCLWGALARSCGEVQGDAYRRTSLCFVWAGPRRLLGQRH